MNPTADGNPSNLRKCQVPGCRDAFYARQMCQTHYMRWWRRRPLLPPRNVYRWKKRTYALGGKAV